MRALAISMALLVVSCGSRTLPPNETDGPIAADGGGNNCPYPEGTCDWDSDCPDGSRCVGAMHTTGVPHAFICRGICQPKTGISTCDPALDYRPSVTLVREGDKVIARITNGGCQPLYRMQGCCGEGDPLIERPAGGGWSSTCDVPPVMCCDAEPTCEPLLPGQTLEERVLRLESVDCCGTTFRVSYFFSRNPSCIDDALHPTPIAQSAGVTLRDEDPCDGPMPTP